MSKRKKPRRSSEPRESRRNQQVETAVRLALERVDAFVNGERVILPSKEHRRAAKTLLDKQHASVRTATLYLLCY